MTRNWRKFFQIALDFLGVTSAGIISFILFNTVYSLTQEIVFIMALASSQISIHALLGSYRQLWRYTSFREMQTIGLNIVLIGSVLTVGIAINLIKLPYQFVFVYSSIFFIIAASARLLRRAHRYIKYRYKNLPKANKEIKVKTLFVGAGTTANKLIQDIQTNNTHLNIVGILDDDSQKIGAELLGIPILGRTTRLEHFIKELEIKNVVIAIPAADKHILSDLVSKARKAHATVKVIPGLYQFADTKTNAFQYPITISDLIDGKEFNQLESIQKEDKKQILITGGAGYIGYHLTDILVNRGYRVKILDNFTYGHHFINSYKDHPNVEIIDGDIANIRDVVRAVKNVDTVIALAAIVGDPACGINAEETLTLNYESTKILIETANFYGVKRLVFASSCSVYGASEHELLTEESSLNPVSLYARTRIMSEDVLKDRCGSVEPVILRLSTVFGYSPRMRFDLVVNLLTVKALLEGSFQVFGGEQWRPFIHCRDAARAFYLAATSDKKIGGNIYNVGSNHMNYQLKDIGRIVSEIIPSTKYELLENSEDNRNYRVNFEKISNELEFNTQISLNEGIQEMVEFIQKDATLKSFNDPKYSNLQTFQRVFGL